MLRPAHLILAAVLLATPLRAEPGDAVLFQEFARWADAYRRAPTPAAREALLPDCVRLASTRHQALLALMQADPRRALDVTHSTFGLPAEVRAFLELPLDASVTWEVLCPFGQPLQHWVVLGDVRYRITPYGKLVDLPSRQGLRAVGFTLDGRAVISDELATRQLPTLDVHGHLVAGAQPAYATTGTRTALLMRVRFSDEAADFEPVSLAGGNALMSSMKTWMTDVSDGALTLNGTVTPTTLALPQTKAWYSAGRTGQLLGDARTASAAAGQNPASFDFDIVLFSPASFGWAGLGTVGGKGSWLNGTTDLGVTVHEVGHNFGLSHANFWRTSDGSTTGPGSSQEYGNPFDVMGGGGSAGHYGAFYKLLNGWLPSSRLVEVPLATTSFSQRVTLVDLHARGATGPQGIRLAASASRDYWVEYRPATATATGVLLNWGSGGGGSSQLLDLTPDGVASNAALVLGRTFADPGAGLYVTPVERASGNASVDVVVNKGAFPGNRRPTVTLTPSATAVARGQAVTFTANAVDPDGDILAYFWEFSDTTFASTNQAFQTRTLNADVDVLARVTVSDMKGLSTSAWAAVKVGSPTTVRLEGRVTDSVSLGGLDNVRVSAAGRSTTTDSSGDYLLVGMSPGTVTVAAARTAYTFTPSGFTNPLTVAATGNTGVNFAGARVGKLLSGRVTSLGAPLAGITVIADDGMGGRYTGVSVADGLYAVPNVPPGSYRLSAQGRPLQTFRFAGCTSPLTMGMADIGNCNVEEVVVPVSGTITASGGATGPYQVTDGLRTVTATGSGSAWSFTFARVEPGTYNIVAWAPGQRVAAQFANPVTVGTTAVTGLAFNAQPGTVYSIRGAVDEGGAPLDGTLMEARTAGGVLSGTSLTDGNGRYALMNLDPATYTVTPSRSGYTFAPASRQAALTSADVTGLDFGVLNANRPPVILVQPTANPAPISGTQATLSVVATDPPPGRDEDLVYAWRQVGATDLTFTPNDNNLASQTSVRFPRAGFYRVTLTVRDPGGKTARPDPEELTLVVPAVPTRLTLSHSLNRALSIGEFTDFTAAVVDQFGDRIDSATDVRWAASGRCGTISGGGRFTATDSGTCTISATFTQGAAVLTGELQLPVLVSPIPRFVERPTVTPVPVKGSTALGQTLGGDDEGEANLVYTWRAINPPAEVAFSANASNAAKRTVLTFRQVGRYQLRVDVADARGLSGEPVFLTVEVVDGWNTLELEPRQASVRPGRRQNFSGRATNFAGSPEPLDGCTWLADGGTVDGSGVFTAGEPGMATVTLRCGELAVSATVEVSDAACGCSSAGGLGGLGLLGLLGLSRRRRSHGGLKAALPGLAAVALAACGATVPPPGATAGEEPGVVRSALGESVGGVPSDQARMLLVLVNQSRHSATTPNGNECGDYRTQFGANVKLPPFVATQSGLQAAGFYAQLSANIGCADPRQMCCPVGDAGTGLGCIGPRRAECAAGADDCRRQCIVGMNMVPPAPPGTSAFDIYGSFGFDLQFHGLTPNLADHYAIWCAMLQQTMPSDLFRRIIYSGGMGGANSPDGSVYTEFAAGAAQRVDGGGACNFPYWTVAWTNRRPAEIPRIPAASAMWRASVGPFPPSAADMYFAANYYDPTGMAPRAATVVVDGHCFDMERAWGFDDNGTYETRFNDREDIPDGCHDYYFRFVDSAGVTHRYPTQGSLRVQVGSTGSQCTSGYTPDPQATADCETGQTTCTTGESKACYLANPQTLRPGAECRQGVQTCRNGFWSSCVGMVPPFPESCDGLDNDCDGQVDEDNPGGGASCVVPGEFGRCQTGVRVCASGRPVCRSVGGAEPEGIDFPGTCDGIDNDCDGTVDDGFPEVSCGEGMCFRLVRTCVSGRLQECVPGEPTSELDAGANLKDDDCDGWIDNGLLCGNPGQLRSNIWPIPGAVTRSPCAGGAIQCLPDGGWSRPAGLVLPRPEVCNGQNDNCDLNLDSSRDDIPLFGVDRCGQGECQRIVPRCTAGSLVTCMPGNPLTEACDGRDNDCNGTIDDGCNCRDFPADAGDVRGCFSGPPSARDAGICRTGVRFCQGGRYGACMGEVLPRRETCDNGIDDDCDGFKDETDCQRDAGAPSDSGIGGGAGGGGGGGDADGGGGGGGGGEGGGGPCGCTSAPAGLAWLALLGAWRRRRAPLAKA